MLSITGLSSIPVSLNVKTPATPVFAGMSATALTGGIAPNLGGNMEIIKTSSNMEFEVIYADGTRRRVKEGVLNEIRRM